MPKARACDLKGGPITKGHILSLGFTSQCGRRTPFVTLPLPFHVLEAPELHSTIGSLQLSRKQSVIQAGQVIQEGGLGSVTVGS